MHYFQSINKMLDRFYENSCEIQCGIDEAGRGSLFGPVVCAGVIFPPEFNHELLNEIKDSKKLSPLKRKKICEFITKHAIYSIKFVDVHDIDTMNILHATMKGFHGVLDDLHERSPYDRVLVDGTFFTPHIKRSGEFSRFDCFSKGDDRFLTIAAASILAKVYRDEYIEKMAHENPALKSYDLLKNKGYGTKRHIDALSELGPTEYHRRSFAPVKKLLQ